MHAPGKYCLRCIPSYVLHCTYMHIMQHRIIHSLTPLLPKNIISIRFQFASLNLLDILGWYFHRVSLMQHCSIHRTSNTLPNTIIWLFDAFSLCYLLARRSRHFLELIWLLVYYTFMDCINGNWYVCTCLYPISDFVVLTWTSGSICTALALATFSTLRMVFNKTIILVIRMPTAWQLNIHFLTRYVSIGYCIIQHFMITILSYSIKQIQIW